jgi:hypothetical protein
MALWVAVCMGESMHWALYSATKFRRLYGKISGLNVNLIDLIVGYKNRNISPLVPHLRLKYPPFTKLPKPSPLVTAAPNKHNIAVCICMG